MLNIPNLNVRIWGTGVYAGRLLSYIDDLNKGFISMTGKKLYNVIGYVDSDRSKTMYDNTTVLHPDELWKSNKYPIIIAIKYYRKVYDKLLEHGYTSEQIYTYDEIVVDNRYLKPYIADIYDYSQEMIGKAGQGRESLLAFVKNISIIKQIEEHKNNPDGFLPLAEAYDSVDLCCGLMSYYGTEILHIPELEYHGQESNNSYIKTIGLYFSRYTGGGTQRVISQLIPIFIQLGYKVVLFTDIKNEDSKEFFLPDGVIRVVTGSEIRNSNWLRKILSEIRNNKIDFWISHAHDLIGNYYIELFMHLNHRYFGIELHYVFTHIIEEDFQRRLRIYRGADRVITLSNTDRLFWHLFDVNSVYISNPIEYLKVSHDEKKIPHSVLWLGRVVNEQKNVLLAVEVMRYVTKKIPDAVLRIVGSGDHSEVVDQLIALIKKYSLEQNVYIYDYDTDVEKYYSTSEVFMMTSSYEGFPMTIIESKMNSLPLVLFDLPYLELLKDGQGYISAPFGDVKGMADAIVRIMTDRELYCKLSEGAKDSIEKFKQHDISKDWDDVIRMRPITYNKSQEQDYETIIRLLVNKI